MDLTQAMQTLKWLDEERRKDKATIAALQERVEGQEQRLAQQAAQIRELQTAMAGVQGVLVKVKEFEETVSNYRNELLLQMDQRDKARRKEMAESERLRRLEYESLIVNLKEMEKELSVLPRYEENLTALRAADQRLNETLQQLEVAVADLGKRSDDRLQTVAYLEEQRRADNRRIVELEHEAVELRKKIENLVKKLPLLEETLQKQQRRVDEAIEETRKYEKPIEELRISDFQREQKMKQYLDQGKQVAAEMERLRVQTQGFIEQQQLVKRALSALEKFRARIERRQDELAERQRMNEEQSQKRWEEWQEARLKEQKKRDVVIEERWRQQRETNETYLKRLDKMQSTLEMHRAQLVTMWEESRAQATSLLKAAQDVYQTLNEPIDEQLAVLHSDGQE
ncbi:MAG: hypothetical protein DRI48_07840 [Chloroflexi bacterium]|nr:MAG: hypothetical protein DRI48_07840 [Chloroflexota bacterium]